MWEKIWHLPGEATCCFIFDCFLSLLCNSWDTLRLLSCQYLSFSMWYSYYWVKSFLSGLSPCSHPKQFLLLSNFHLMVYIVIQRLLEWFRPGSFCLICSIYVGGSSKTLMIVHLSPNASNLSETLSSLNFSARARNAVLSLGNRDTIKKWRDIVSVNIFYWMWLHV